MGRSQDRRGEERVGGMAFNFCCLSISPQLDDLTNKLGD